jgi:uridine kinase
MFSGLIFKRFEYFELLSIPLPTIQTFFSTFATMKKPYIIGITGGSGSGKTTFIRYLREAFTPEQICIVSQDDYYRPREEQKVDSEGVANFDRPFSVDKKALYRDIELLSQGKNVEILEYTFNNDEKEPKKIILKPAPILIVEGLFVFHYKKIRKKLDIKVFVHAKENLKVIRRIHRDRVERNYPLDDVLYRYQNHVLPAFEKYIEPYMEEADLIINNNKSFEKGLQIFQHFLHSKLKEK